MMHPPDCLGEHSANLQDLQFVTPPLVLFLVDTVRNHHSVQGARIYPVDGVTAEHTVSHQCVDFGGAFPFEEFCGASDGIGCIC